MIDRGDPDVPVPNGGHATVGHNGGPAFGHNGGPAFGHNGGPAFDDTPGYLLRRYYWAAAHREVWSPPSMAVLKFRLSRAHAAGLSYRAYMLQMLDGGRPVESADGEQSRRRPAKPTELGGATKPQQNMIAGRSAARP